jgi:hypothetical protein
LTSGNIQNLVNKMVVNYLSIKLKENIYLIHIVKKIFGILGICNRRPPTNDSIQPLQGWYPCLRPGTGCFTTGYSSSGPSGLAVLLSRMERPGEGDHASKTYSKGITGLSIIPPLADQFSIEILNFWI